MDLFSYARHSQAPLADRMRPRTLDEFLGQRELVGPGRLLRRAIEADRLTSSIFYGPPGTGKTTLANIVAHATDAAFEKLNAVIAGVADVREVIARAQERLGLYAKPTYLLLDECHRWSKAQSDSILPAIENGTIRFIGSTTENPMVAMTPAILSRCRLFAFVPLGQADILQALHAAIADTERGYGHMHIQADPGALEHLARVADGDARSALNALELAVLTTHADQDGIVRITLEVAQQSIQQRVLRVDESYYFDMLSAFCKSMRGSDSDAALAWAFRLLHAGIDPRVIVRRMIAHASEDVGLADPQAMLQAIAALQAVKDVGLPEAALSITQAIIYICEAPKSNAVVAAKTAAQEYAAQADNAPVPMHLRNDGYRLHERMQEKQPYKYAHDYPNHWVEQPYMPQDASGKTFYQPSDQGYEQQIVLERRRKRGLAQPGAPHPDKEEPHA